MRIVSLTPSGTELVCALDHAASLIGISHACDHPGEITHRPRVTMSRMSADLPADAIDARVREPQPMYEIDIERLATLQPDIVITQRQCTVCAVGEADVTRVLAHIGSSSRIVALEASRFHELPDDVRRLGRAMDSDSAAERLIARWRNRLDAVHGRTCGLPAPRVLAMSWFAPLMAAGHWVTEMISLAGGRDEAFPLDAPSRRLEPAEIAAYAPEVVLLMPCGFSQARTLHEWALQRHQARWSHLEAVRSGRVFAVEGALFHRPGPRLIDGVELLAALLHPTRMAHPSRALFTVAA